MWTDGQAAAASLMRRTFWFPSTLAMTTYGGSTPSSVAIDSRSDRAGAISPPDPAGACAGAGRVRVTAGTTGGVSVVVAVGVAVLVGVEVAAELATSMLG